MTIHKAFDEVDYVSVVDPQTLMTPKSDANTFVVVVAAHLGKTRLIDNTVLGVDPAP